MSEKPKLSPERKGELKNYCRQYDSWVTQLEKGVERKGGLAFVPKRLVKGSVSDPTVQEAGLREKLHAKKELVDKAAAEADPDFSEEIIQIVCYGKKYDRVWFKESGLKDAVEYFYILLDWLKD